MSEYRQQAFGQPTFIDASASGSLSGHDHFDMLDSNLYHEHEYQRQRVHSLHIPAHTAYPHGQQFAYASHSSSASVPGKRIFPFNLPFVRLHMPAIRRRISCTSPAGGALVVASAPAAPPMPLGDDVRLD